MQPKFKISTDKKSKKQHKQPQQGNPPNKIKAWCGICYQCFENGPHSKICKDHYDKRNCHLVNCKKNSNIECIRKFPNTNSENRHTYCIEENAVKDFNKELNLQYILGNKRKEERKLEELMLNLKEDSLLIDEKNENKSEGNKKKYDTNYYIDSKFIDKSSESNNFEDVLFKKIERKESNCTSKQSLLNNINKSSIIKRSYEGIVHNTKEAEDHDQKEQFKIDEIMIFNKSHRQINQISEEEKPYSTKKRFEIPNILDEFEKDNISLKTIIYEEKNEPKTKRNEKKDNDINKNSKELIDNLIINESIHINNHINNDVSIDSSNIKEKIIKKLKNESVSSLLISNNKIINSSKIINQKQTSNINLHLDKRISNNTSLKNSNFNLNFNSNINNSVFNSNIFDLYDKINNLDIKYDIEKYDKRLNEERFFNDEEEVLYNLDNFHFSNLKLKSKPSKENEKDKKSVGIQTENSSINIFNPIKKNDDFNISKISENTDDYLIKGTDLTEEFFNQFNKLANTSYSKQFLNKIKSLFKKKGIENILSIRLLISNVNLWFLFKKDLISLSSQAEGFLLLLENLILKRNK